MIQNSNGYITWESRELRYRDMFVKFISDDLFGFLRNQNRAFSFHQIDSPTLIPTESINHNYSQSDYYNLGEKSLRPETTSGSYAYARHLLKTQKHPFPAVIWQVGKSYRREQDQGIQYMRLKEFYQMEFQIIFSENTKNDYYELLIDKVPKIINQFMKVTVVESDRLPSYSLKTMDIEVNGMEVCSMSNRTDFEGYKNAEIAFGLDRLVYQFLTK